MHKVWRGKLRKTAALVQGCLACLRVTGSRTSFPKAAAHLRCCTRTHLQAAAQQVAGG